MKFLPSYKSTLPYYSCYFMTNQKTLEWANMTYHRFTITFEVIALQREFQKNLRMESLSLYVYHYMYPSLKWIISSEYSCNFCSAHLNFAFQS